MHNVIVSRDPVMVISNDTNIKAPLKQEIKNQDEKDDYFSAWPMLNMFNRRIEAGMKSRRLFAFPKDNKI